MELVPALLPRPDQAGGLEHVEVLRDRLPRQAEPVVGQQPPAQLEERLTVAVSELVEDRAARGSRQGLEDVRHLRTIGKWLLACQASSPIRPRLCRICSASSVPAAAAS